MHESIEFQLLCGIMLEDRNIFWTLYMTSMLLIYGLALGYISVKEIKHIHKMRMTIHVNIPEQPKPVSIFDYLGKSNF